MTRSPRDAGRAGSIRGGARSRPVRDPYGLLPAGTPIAAAASVIGLVLVAIVTLSLSSGNVPLPASGGGPNASGGGGIVARTPTPPDKVIVPSSPPEEQLKGTLVYAKDGNVWLQAAGAATKLTSGGNDSMPSFSPDGKYVYFIRTRTADGRWRANNATKTYRLEIPALMRIPTAGGKTERLYDGKVKSGSLTWAAFMREPVLSPNGRTVALFTDLPDPWQTRVVLQFYDLRTGKLTNPHLPQVDPLGHQDADWRFDGKRLLYVHDNRDGSKGTPALWLYNTETQKARALTGPGYLHPSYSRDGKWIAATKTSAFGTDVVILNAATGAEVLRLTTDGNSWAPTWSPTGGQVAFLHVAGQVVDLRMIQLDGTGPTWTPKDPVDLTESAGLDSLSRPDWFVPQSDLSAPTPAVSPGPS